MDHWMENYFEEENNLSVCYYHITYEFQSESTLYSLPECQGTTCSKHVPYLTWFVTATLIRTHNHLVRKRTLLASNLA